MYDADRDCPYGNDDCTHDDPCQRCGDLTTRYTAQRKAYAMLARTRSGRPE